MTLKMATPPLDACVIGFAGHRKLIPSLEATVHADLPAIIATLRETLLADLGENQKFVLANGLAAGADLLVAAQFEKHFPEIELWHCLPMPEEEFRQGLLDGLENTDEISCKRIADEFDRLTASARYLSVIEAENRRRAEAYLLLAHAMVARCEGLVVVWDGMPAAGPGGTGDVVRVGTDAGLPVLHLKGEGQVGMMPSCANDLSKRESGKIFARLLAEKFFARRTEEGHCLKLKGAGG